MILNIPISQQAAAELEELNQVMSHHVLNEENDQRTFCWGSDKFAAAKLYKLAFSHLESPSMAVLIWKSKVTPRVKFFMWLIYMDRLNTKSMLVRRNFNVGPNSLCVLCGDNEEETIDHLFFQCSFARRCWDKLGISWVNDPVISRRVTRTKIRSTMPFFMEIFQLAAWELWKMRNRLVFDGVQASNRWVQNFKDEATLQSVRIKEENRPAVMLWLDAL